MFDKYGTLVRFQSSWLGLRVCSLMVKYSTHNANDVGSNPAKPSGFKSEKYEGYSSTVRIINFHLIDMGL